MDSFSETLNLENSPISRAIELYKSIDFNNLDTESLKSLQIELIDTLRDYNENLGDDLKSKIAYLIDEISNVISLGELKLSSEQIAIVTEIFDNLCFLAAKELPVYRDKKYLGALNSVLNMVQLNSPKFHEFLVRVHRETGADVVKLETPLWPLILVNEIKAARKVLDVGLKGTEGGFFESINEFVAEVDHVEGLNDREQPFSILARETLNPDLDADNSTYYLEHKRKVLRALSGPNINGFTESFVGQAEQMVDGWNNGEEMNVVDEFDQLTFGGVLELFMGIKDLDDASKLRITKYFKEGSQYLAMKSLMGDKLGGLIGKLKDKWYEEETAFYHSVVDPAIEARMEDYKKRIAEGTPKEGTKDLLDHLIENGFSLPQIQTHIKEFMLAGQDTTSSALSSAMHRLLENPNILEILKNEIRNVAGERTEISHTDLKNLPFLTNVVKEVLRIDPPTHIIPRLAPKDFELNGMRIHKGDVMMVSVQAIHHDDKNWANADEFIPGRPQWEETNPEAYFTFGKGERTCVGKLFAEREISLVLAFILLNYNFELVDNKVKIISGTKTQRPERLIVSATEVEG